MTMRIPRVLLVLVLAAITSGAHSVVRAALNEDCCKQGCHDPSDRAPCPLECVGPCAHATTTLAASAAPYVGREPTARSTATRATARPVLPLVITGVFQPPRA